MPNNDYPKPKDGGVAVGAYLRAMREAAGISVKDLAEKIGADNTAIWRIEAWKSDSRSSVLLKFVCAVRASADDVVLLMNNPDATREDGERLAHLRTGIR